MAYDPRDPYNMFQYDFADPTAALSNLGPTAAAGSSGGGTRRKPQAPAVNQTGPAATNAPAAPATPNPLLARFNADLAAATTPLARKRAYERYQNAKAGEEAKAKMAARTEGYRESARAKNRAKKAKAQTRLEELSAEVQANPLSNLLQPPTAGPEATVDRMNAEYSKQIGARQELANRYNAMMAEAENRPSAIPPSGYDKVEATRLNPPQVVQPAKSTFIPRDVNALMARTPTGQLAQLATSQPIVTDPLVARPYPAQPVQMPMDFVAMNQAADRELLDQQNAQANAERQAQAAAAAQAAQREREIQALVEGSMARYEAARNPQPAPALGARNPAAEAQAAAAPRLSRSQIPAGVPTMGGADPEQVAFNQKVQDLMARGLSNQEAVSVARGENPTPMQRVQERITQDPNLAVIDPQGLNVMSAMDVLGGEGAGLAASMGARAAARGMGAAGRGIRNAATRATEAVPPSAPGSPGVDAGLRAGSPLSPEDQAALAELRSLEGALKDVQRNPVPGESVRARTQRLDQIRTRINQLRQPKPEPVAPEITTTPAAIPEGPAFARPGDELPALEGARRRRPERFSPEGIEAANKEGMLFDIGRPAAPKPTTPPPSAAEAANAAKTAPKPELLGPDNANLIEAMAEGGLFTPQNIRRMRKLAEQRRLAKEFPR